MTNFFANFYYGSLSRNFDSGLLGSIANDQQQATMMQDMNQAMNQAKQLYETSISCANNSELSAEAIKRVCLYCRSKVEAGTTRCPSCGAPK